MNNLSLKLQEDRTQFRPGEAISGTARWQLDHEPRSAEVRLFWFTRGKGTTDVGVVETQRFDHPMAHGSHPFRFRLPVEPYSFSGKLISLVWALELVIDGKEAYQLEITVSPTGQEVKLGAPAAAALRR